MKLSVIIITCILSFNYGECRPKTGPTIIALPFNAVDDANAIISAMEKSSSDNKDKIVDILMSKTIAQRLEIGAEYEKIKNMDFKKEIEKYFNGKLDSDKNMLEILKTTTEFLASRLHHSLTKCDNEDYMSIMITSSTEMLRNVCATYQKEYNQEVSSDVNAHLSYDNELSGFINKLISYDIDEQRSDHAKVDDELTKKLVSAMPTKTSVEFYNHVPERVRSLPSSLFASTVKKWLLDTPLYKISEFFEMSGCEGYIVEHSGE
ncbi:uncharacterized protein LOC111048640 isoform X2 [Nilaparvata lugens]|uniref:uncharacterized protein LOC111048640 isoform X2 n=1 Tax=Nilaparvata lugens TaxID=108931 RepID=UPI00193CA2AC|nr:uncharacterized protein LOC111048640 isoform X2 [Nilaparvata lugens]